MAEEVRIKVVQENQGDALKKAAEDAEALNKQARIEKLAGRFERSGLDKEAATAKARLAVQHQEEARAHKAAQKQQVATTKQAVKERTDAEKQAAQENVKAHQAAAQAQTDASRKAQQAQGFGLEQKEVEAAEHRAAGRKKEAEALEKHVFLQRRSVELQHQYGLSQADALKHAEREHAVMKAKGGHGGHGGGLMGVARGGGEFLDTVTGGSGYVMRGVQLARLAQLMKNPYVAGAMVLAAAVASPLIARGIKDSEHAKDQALADEMREKARASERERGHRSDFGTASESAAKVREAADAIKELHEHEKTRYHEVHDSAGARFLRTITLGFSDKWREQGMFGHKSAYAREREHDEREKERLKKEEAEDKKLAAEQFAKVEKPQLQATRLRNAGKTEEAEAEEITAKVEEERRRLASLERPPAEIDQLLVRKRKELEEGGYETWRTQGGRAALDAQEKMNEGKMKEARALQYTAHWWEVYNATRAKFGGGTAHDAEAKEAADAEILSLKRQQAQAMAGAITARTGAGAAARIATMAAGMVGLHVNGQGGGVVDHLRAMHGTMRDQYNRATEQAWRAKFPHGGTRR